MVLLDTPPSGENPHLQKLGETSAGKFSITNMVFSSMSSSVIKKVEKEFGELLGSVLQAVY